MEIKLLKGFCEQKHERLPVYWKSFYTCTIIGPDNYRTKKHLDFDCFKGLLKKQFYHYKVESEYSLYEDAESVLPG